MRLTIGDREYDRLKSLTFAPEADLMCQSLPVNEFRADIVTGDDVDIGQYAALRDDLGALWAKYWIVYAEHIDRQTLRVRARSPLWLLDGGTLPARLYSAEPVEDVLPELFGAVPYALDPAFAGSEITGFCPKQTPRQRLLWVCFALGAYVKSCFCETLQLLPVGEDAARIPLDRTYWKPSMNYTDHVTSLRVTFYRFTPGVPSPTDRWVKDGAGNVYLMDEQTAELVNPAAPAGAPENCVLVDGVTLIHSGNVSSVLSRLARWRFARAKLSLDVIHNGDYAPGDRVVAHADEDALCAGHIESCDFSFGVQSRAALRLLAVDPVASARLTVEYLWERMTLARDAYALPEGYGYAIQARYLDWTLGPRRYIFRPEPASVAGTLPPEGAAETVQCQIALDCLDGILTVVSTDALTPEEGVLVIA